MPKIKTHSGAKKRLSRSPRTVKVKPRPRWQVATLLNGHGKTTKRKRGLRKDRP